MHEVGNVTQLGFTVASLDQSLVDADVTLTVTGPDLTDSALTPARASVGRYTALFVPTEPGRHVVRWAATGAVARSKVDVLNVAAAVDTPAIISLDEAREHLNISADVTVEDDELRAFIAAASGVVERHTGQVVARRTLVESHVVRDVLLLRPPIVSITSVVGADGTVTDPSGLVVDGFTGIVTGVSGAVTVTYVAGPPMVAPEYVTATQIICAHLWATQRPNQFSSAPSFNSDTPSAVVGMGYALPNRAAELLGGRAPNMP